MRRKLSEEEIEYQEFVYNPENIRNCEECPNNQGCDDFQHRLPCGQWLCIVETHCRSGVDDDDE